MSSYPLANSTDFDQPHPDAVDVVLAEVVPEQRIPQSRPRRRKIWLPVGLFAATCVTTLAAGAFGGAEGLLYVLMHGIEGSWLEFLREATVNGLKYALPVMTILFCHEMGHFLQAWRYGVRASLPFFIPMPIGPLGTMGAVIAMDPRQGDRKALFDIGISGPLAGLVPTLIFCVVGLSWSEIVPGRDVFGDPILFRAIAEWLKGPIPPGHVIHVHPMAFAGWVGLLITALNLMPIGQLDGGHILYGLLRKKAHVVASLMLFGAVAAVVGFQLWNWTLMIFLLFLIGPIHPPTVNDDVPLGFGRYVLGWLTLAFIPIGFTPTPFLFGN